MSVNYVDLVEVDIPWKFVWAALPNAENRLTSSVFVWFFVSPAVSVSSLSLYLHLLISLIDRCFHIKLTFFKYLTVALTSMEFPLPFFWVSLAANYHLLDRIFLAESTPVMNT
ncbi:hypothetical protein BJX70DRAFT_400129 [Aspergillus crustosus]